MKKILLFFLSLIVTTNAQVKYEDYFADNTLRLDFYQTGNKSTETISFEKLVEEGLWSGPKNNLIDKFGYGNYFLKVLDASSKSLIFSRGFSSLYQEWQTTDRLHKYLILPTC